MSPLVTSSPNLEVLSSLIPTWTRIANYKLAVIYFYLGMYIKCAFIRFTIFLSCVYYVNAAHNMLFPKNWFI
jgi:hypothetical protein